MQIRQIKVLQVKHQPPGNIRIVRTPALISFSITGVTVSGSPEIAMHVGTPPHEVAGNGLSSLEDTLAEFDNLRGADGSKLVKYLGGHFPTSENLEYYEEPFRVLTNVVLWLQPGYLHFSSVEELNQKLIDEFIIDYNGRTGNQRDIYITKATGNEPYIKEFFAEGLLGKLIVEIQADDGAITENSYYFVPFDKRAIEKEVEEKDVLNIFQGLATSDSVARARKVKLRALLNERDIRIRKYIMEQF